MSKIEVLRHGNGSLCIHRNGECHNTIQADEKPALLAALLEDAGAERIFMGSGRGWCHVLPIRKEGE